MRILFLLFSLLSAVFTASAQGVVVLKQQALSKWKIGAANYSGITPIGDNRYALVSDGEPDDGFFTFLIDVNQTTGKVMDVYLEGWHGNKQAVVSPTGSSPRDCEAIAYFPVANTVFIAGEGDQQILEYTLDGQPTGRRLEVPDIFRTIQPNAGFESLTYDAGQHRFWTTTESTLPADGDAPSAAHPGAVNLLRLQSFDDALRPAEQYAYRTEAGRSSGIGSQYACGVSDLCALPDGRLVVMEREVNVKSDYIGSDVVVRLFLVNPAKSQPITSRTALAALDGSRFLPKQLLAEFTTKLAKFNFANYEGICLGPKLHDGRQTLLLVNDSQNGAGNPLLHLKDYLRVVILPAGL